MAITFVKKDPGQQLDMFPGGNPYANVSTGLLKSMIQKAFRRNHVDMLKGCFQALAAKEYGWLQWRFMVWPMEDAWRSTVVMGRIVHETSKWKAEDQKAALLGILLEEARRPKSQDANGLCNISRVLVNAAGKVYHASMIENLRNTTTERERSLINRSTDLYKLLHGGECKWPQLKPIWATVWERVETFDELPQSTYKVLRDGVGAAYFRSMRGGGADYQHLFMNVANLILDAFEHEEYDYVFGDPGSTIQRVGDSMGEIPDTLIPWYCQDMHTGTGRRVLAYVSKVFSEKYDKDFIEELWFEQETALLNAETGNYWGLMKAAVYHQWGLTPEQANAIWLNEVGPLIKDKVLEFSD